MPDPYRMQRVRCAYVDVVGTIWMPAVTCGMRYPLSDYDLRNIGEFTRENVEHWLSLHSGDFQSIQDFEAHCGDTVIPWATEEGETAFIDATNAGE